MVILPMAVSALGIVASIIGGFFVNAKNEHQLHGALFRGSGSWLRSLVAGADLVALHGVASARPASRVPSSSARSSPVSWSA
jgi:Na+/H+-translocating membrane pyrophosphatase